MGKTKIEYADMTWNPIVGCKHGCFYCYAKRMNDRFKWIEQWDKPFFYSIRLSDPLNRKKPTTYLVGSMCDGFGDWIPRNWIQLIIDKTKNAKQHTFLFLTKNPRRYHEFEFPSNCFLGTTVTTKRDFYNIEEIKLLDRPYWISFEPLMERPYIECTFNDPAPAWVVIGAMTGPYKRQYQPKKEWISRILQYTECLGIPVFMKDNLKDYWPVELIQEGYEI